MRKTLLFALSCLLPILGAGARLTSQTVSQTGTYSEPLRPQVHFSPREHWMNDPNGLVFFEGEYHLFFQYNPFGDTPGNISWGHAVSTDLLHWEQLPVAIPAIPGPQDELVFTGSVVVDEHNTSNLCANAKPCLVAIYTAHHDPTSEAPERTEAQSLAVSQDRGRTWIRYANNPVLDLHLPEFRDPGVTWNDLTHSWLMVVSLPRTDQVVFFTSPNLKEWTRLTTFGPAGTSTQLNPHAQWECPNLLQVPATDGKGPGMWALKVGLNPGALQGGSGEQYFLGNFDGHTFTPSTQRGAHGWTDYGKDSYCAISYNHLPPGTRPTLIGWMDNWQYADKLPTSPWRGQMTLPRHATILTDAAGIALQQEPIVAPLHTGPSTAINASLKPGANITISTTVPRDLTLTFTPADAQQFGLRIYTDQTHFSEVAFDLPAAHLYTDRTHSISEKDASLPDFASHTDAPIVPSRPYDLHLILDRSSIELFAQNGTIAMTTLVLPATQTVRLELFSNGGTQPTAVSGQSWLLKSVWK